MEVWQLAGVMGRHAISGVEIDQACGGCIGKELMGAMWGSSGCLY